MPSASNRSEQNLNKTVESWSLATTLPGGKRPGCIPAPMIAQSSVEPLPEFFNKHGLERKR